MIIEEHELLAFSFLSMVSECDPNHIRVVTHVHTRIEFIYKSNSIFGRWWDCIALPDDVDPSDEGAFRTQIKDLACTVCVSFVFIIFF